MVLHLLPQLAGFELGDTASLAALATMGRPAVPRTALTGDGCDTVDHLPRSKRAVAMPACMSAMVTAMVCSASASASVRRPNALSQRLS